MLHQVSKKRFNIFKNPLKEIYEYHKCMMSISQDLPSTLLFISPFTSTGPMFPHLPLTLSLSFPCTCLLFCQGWALSCFILASVMTFIFSLPCPLRCFTPFVFFCSWFGSFCFPPCPLSCLLSRLFSSVLPHLCPYISLLSLTLPCHQRIPLLSFLPSPLLYLITCLCPCFSVIGSKASFDYSLCIYGKKLRSFELSYDHMLHLSLAQSAFCLN